jgi:aspartate racemase
MIGVLGGMGPAATIDFLERLVKLTPATRDQDHVPVLVYGDPRVPDRTAAIAGRGPSPLPSLRRGVSFLAGSGVDCIVIPCNTAHVWLADLRSSVAVPILSIIDEAVARVRVEAGGVERVGVLSTEGTRASRLYRAALEAADLVPVEASTELMRTCVTPGIEAVKGGELDLGREYLAKGAAALAEDGAEAVIVGCTDISVVIRGPHDTGGVPVIDANGALAHAVLERHQISTGAEDPPVRRLAPAPGDSRPASP